MPPPVHGMALVTAAVSRSIAAHCAVVLADISPGKLQRGAAYHLRKSWRVLGALLLLLRQALGRHRRLYLPADARWGLIYTSLLGSCARLLGFRIVVHHHSFAYLVAADWRMRLLTRCCGPRARHVLLCEAMEARMRGLYPAAQHTLVLSNALFCSESARPARPAGCGLRLGHLGNLSRDKGLDLVLSLFEMLQRRHPRSRLVLAGPPVQDEDVRMLADARARLGAAIDYRGAVDEQAKGRFYGDIDVFLFPSRATEAQPLVILEALASGVPAIAFERGCIAPLLAGGGGIAVQPQEDFVAASLPILSRWAGDERSMEEASRQALDSFRRLRQDALRERETFLSQLTGAGRGRSRPTSA
jgi:glycosyltransferase involved in cell wall biosynthesis